MANSRVHGDFALFRAHRHLLVSFPGIYLYSIMASEEHASILDHILNPKEGRSDDILDRMGLYSLPTREQIHSEIEEKLLLPKDKFPSHWLPTYQV